MERGDKLRMYHQIKGLSKDHNLILFSLTDKAIDDSDYAEIKKYCQEIHIFKVNVWSKIIGLIRAIGNRLPFQVGLLLSPKIKQNIHKIFSTKKIDLAYCQLIRMAPYVMDLDGKKYIDYMDAYGIGMSKRAKISKGILHFVYNQEAKRVKNFEKKIYSMFDGHSIISDQDARHIMPSGLDIVTNGIDIDTFSPKNIDPKYDIGFIGNMGYLPNVGAAEIIALEISPKYLNKFRKPLKILIAGARPSARVTSLETNDIKVSGWVDDITEAYASCKILVAPLYNGTGQQNKILEAMSMGIPCITTSEVNRAIGGQNDHSIVLADDTDSFVRQINKLLSDPELRKKIGNNGKSFVHDNYKWDKSIEHLKSCFERTLSN